MIPIYIQVSRSNVKVKGQTGFDIIGQLILLLYIRGVFGKYVEKFNRMHIKYTRNMTFGINEYQVLNIKYDQYENLTLINDSDIGH